MAVIAVLNTLVQADTSAFDRGMDRAGASLGGFAAAVGGSGGVLAGTFKAFGASGLLSLSGLGGAVGGIDARINAVWKTATLFLSTILSIASVGATIGSRLGGAFQYVLGPLAALVRGAGGLVAGMLRLGSGAVGSMGADLAGTLFGGLGPRLRDALTGAVGVAGGALSGLAGIGRSAAEGMTGAIGSTLRGAAGLFGVLKTAGAAAIDGLSEKLTTWGGAAVRGFGAVADQAMGLFRRFGSALPGILSGALGGLGNILAPLRGLTGGLGNLAGPLVSGMVEQLGKLGPMLGRVVAGAAEQVPAILGAALRRTGELFAPLVGAAGNAFGGVGRLVRSAAGTIAEGFGSVVGVVRTKLGEIGQGVLSVTRSAAGWLGGMASTVGAGFHSLVGMASSALGTIGTWIGNVAANAVGTVASVLGGAIGLISTPLIIAGGIIGGGLALVAGALAVATAGAIGLALALSHMGSAGAESIASLVSYSKELGINVHSLSAIANTAGLSAEGMTHSLIHMQRAINDNSASAAAALDKMGLSLAEMQEKSPAKQLDAIYAGFGRLTSQADRASVTFALFGRGGIQMMESLSRGTEGLETARRNAERFGLTFTEAEGNLVRRSLKAWGQWSLAMEGVSRKLAVIFAPMWEQLGNIGGNIGEFLVKLVSDRRMVQAVHGVWGALGDAGRSVWAGITDAAAHFWNDTLGLSNIGVGDIKEAFIAGMVVVEYAIRNAGPLIGQVWNEIKLKGLEVADAVVQGINKAIGAINAMMTSAVGGINRILEAVAGAWNKVIDGMARLTGGDTAIGRGIQKLLGFDPSAMRIQAPHLEVDQISPIGTKRSAEELTAAKNLLEQLQAEARQFPERKIELLGLAQEQVRILEEGFGSHLGDMVNEARQAVDAGRQNIADSFGAFMTRRLNEIRTGAEVMGNAADAADQAANAASSAIHGLGQGGNAAPLAGSQEAFSLINSRQGTLDTNMRNIGETLKRQEQTLYDILGAFREAPIVRNAEI